MQLVSSITIVLAATSSCANAFAPSNPLSTRGVASSSDSNNSLSMGLQVGDSFPTGSLKQIGASGKKSVIYFYGADDAPSCKKQNSGFAAQLSEFQLAGAAVIGVRNGAGVKGDNDEITQSLVVDEDDEIRNEIGIAKDLFGLLGGRETYVVEKDGTVGFVFNSQFKPEDHVSKSLEYVESTQVVSGGSGGGFKLPDFGAFFNKE